MASGNASADNSRTTLRCSVADVNMELLLLVLAHMPMFVEGAMLSVPFDLVFAYLQQCRTSAECF